MWKRDGIADHVVDEIRAGRARDVEAVGSDINSAARSTSRAM